MDALGLRLSALLYVLLLCSSCHAQAGSAFRWKFTNSSNRNDQTLTECDAMNIQVSSLTNSASAGKAPYYLLAFTPNGLVTRTLVGSGPDSLVWQVNHRAGSKLVLSMSDADGNSGEVLDTIFTVVGGSSRSCLVLPSPSLSPPTLVSNVSDTLRACQNMQLSVSGGVPPYVVSIVVLGSTVINNYTVPQGVGLFSYINSHFPSTRFLAAISDSRGVYGNSTQIVNIVNSNDTSCEGPLHVADMTTLGVVTNGMNHRAIIIIAVCATAGGCLLIVATAVLVWLNCRARRRRGMINGQDTVPRAFALSQPTGAGSASLCPFRRAAPPVLDISSRNESPSSASLTTLTPAAMSRPQINPFPYDPSHVVTQRPSNSSMRPTQGHESQKRNPPSREVVQRPSNSSLRHGMQNHHPQQSSSRDENPVPTNGSPVPPSASRSRRVREQQLTTSRSMGDLCGPSNFPRRHNAEYRLEKQLLHISRSAGDIRRAATFASQHHVGQQLSVSRSLSSDTHPTNHVRNIMSVMALDSDVEPDIIIQHRDGGLVQELPPPYHDRLYCQPRI